SNDNIASFSSRGHSTWQSDAPWYDYPDSGGGLIDPDIAAPGVNITSCTWPSNSGYTTMDGTSMATPHVAGVMALLLDAVPSLTPADVEYYMEMNALELGASGKDNTYGAGRVDAYDAVSAALGGTGTTDDQIGVVSTPGILLSPVTPNPVMASAQFTVSTGSTCPADISIFDISGRKVAVIQNGEMEAGAHAFRWTPPSGVSNGIYFVQVVSQGELVTERFTIIR
nr:S8 family peptidase [FCB group bacterium]